MRMVVCCLAGLVALSAAAEPLQPLQRDIYAARDRVMPALVHIQPISEVFARGKRQKTTSVGSGVIISPQGHIVTNYHVVGRVKELLVTLANKDRVAADLIGGDPLTDIAVIQLATAARANLPRPAVLGRSDTLEVGEYVMALGSPLALSRSLSLGVVSCVDRYFPDAMTLPTGEVTGRFNTWIQTDAAINPGNSGGPLINLRGEVIGINARMAFFGENVGFAIPVDVVKEVVDKLIRDGRVSRSWIGVEIQSLDEVRRHFGALEHGALISSVAPGSPAATAGVRPGDLLLELDGEPVSARFDEEVPAILKRIADTPVGRSLALTLAREGRLLRLEVATEDLGKSISAELDCPAWGITVREITRPVMLALNLRVSEGVLVTSVAPGSELTEQLTPGDVISEVNGETTPNVEAFQARYLALLAEEPEYVLLRVRRNAAMRLALVKPTYRPHAGDAAEADNRGEIPGEREELESLRP